MCWCGSKGILGGFIVVRGESRKEIKMISRFVPVVSIKESGIIKILM